MIESSIERQIAEIEVSDVAALSRHDAGAARALTEAIEHCVNRDDVKVFIFTLGQGGDGQGLAEDSVTIREQAFFAVTGLYQAITFANKVTILVVDGNCAGAGSLLALSCDFVVAGPQAEFHSPFAVAPEANFVLAALIMRLNRAKQWALGDRPLSAAEAHAAGFVNEVAGDPLAAARAMARSIGRVPLDGLAMSKLMTGAVMDAQGVGQDFDMAGFHAQAHQFGQAWHG
ncbi:MAG: enoyl-CoA hydratase/isomerase family protein [Pseudomonadota bacterium]